MKTRILLSAIALVGLLGLSNSSFAQDGRWNNNHPRRAQVNHRLSNQYARIHHQVENGNMGRAEAARLHHEDRSIRHEEQRMAYRNHGHITRAEQYRINRQEDYVSRQIARH